VEGRDGTSTRGTASGRLRGVTRPGHEGAHDESASADSEGSPTRWTAARWRRTLRGASTRSTSQPARASARTDRSAAPVSSTRAPPPHPGSEGVSSSWSVSDPSITSMLAGPLEALGLERRPRPTLLWERHEATNRATVNPTEANGPRAWTAALELERGLPCSKADGNTRPDSDGSPLAHRESDSRMHRGNRRNRQSTADTTPERGPLEARASLFGGKMVSRTFPSRASRRGLAATGWPRGLGLAVGDVTMEGSGGRWTLQERP